MGGLGERDAFAQPTHYVDITMLTVLRDTRTPSLLMAGLVGAMVGGLCLISPALALAAIGAAGFTLVVLRFPIVLCYTLVAAVTLVSGVTRGKLVPMLRINELLLVVAVAFLAVFLLIDRARSANLGKIKPVLGPFVILVLGTVFIPIAYHYSQGQPASIDGLMDMVSPFKFFLLFLVFVIIPKSEAEWYPLVVWMVICGAIVAVVGLLQAANVSAIHQLIGSWYASAHTAASLEGEGGRVTSLMGAWNALGMLLMMALAVGWSALQVPGMRTYRVVLGGASILSFLCLIASGSFAGIVGLVMSVLLIELLTNNITTTLKKIGMAAAVGALGLAVAFPLIQTVVLGRLDYQFGDSSGSMLPQTFVYRFWIWTDVFWPQIVKNPIFGTSLDIPHHYRWLFAESHYISLLFRFGVVGLTAHILWTLMMLGWLLSHVRRPNHFSRKMAAAAFAALVVMTISSSTNEVFLFTGSIDYLWILFALVASQGKASEQ
jgi:hypothetical protein